MTRVIKWFKSPQACAQRYTEITGESSKHVEGYCAGYIGELGVAKAPSRDYERKILLHELIHDQEWLNNAVKPLQETQVEMLTTGLLNTFKDNPKLTRFLFLEEDE